LVKGDNFLDLSNPEEYISYKILLTRKNEICTSEDEFKRNPKHTYQFVITDTAEELSTSIEDLTSKAKAYKLFSEIETDYEKLAYLCEKVSGKIIHKSNKELVLDSINKAILNQTAKFIQEISNKYIDTEILIKKAVDRGFIKKFKTEYVLTDGNITLCGPGKIPTLGTACEFLNQPKNQEHKLLIEALVNK